MKLSRRQWIAGSIATACVAAAVPYGLWKIKHGKASEIIIAILQRRVGYLNVEPEIFAQYADDYVESKKSFESQLAKLSVIATPLRYITPYSFLDMEHPLRRLEDNVVSNFLLSTDFFRNQADESRKLSYIGLYDTISHPCTNPFHSYS